MTWIKIDDTVTEHPKCVALSSHAWTLWLHGLTYCSRNLTDGEIPGVMLPRLSGVPQPKKVAGELVKAGLWHEADGGYRLDTEDSPAEVPLYATRYGPVYRSDIVDRGRRNLPADVRRRVLERDGHRCQQCGTTDRLEIDHVIPLRHGGDFLDMGNLQVLCKSCNCSKGAKL